MQASLQNNTVTLSSKSTSAKVVPGKHITVDSQNVDWPGEYEISGVSIRALSAKESEMVFLVTVDDVRMLFPANVGLGAAEESMKEIGDADVVFVFADSSVWSAKEWKKYLEEIDSRIVIFGENGEKTAALQKELGIADIEKTGKLDISQKNLPADKTKYVSLIIES